MESYGRIQYAPTLGNAVIPVRGIAASPQIITAQKRQAVADPAVKIAAVDLVLIFSGYFGKKIERLTVLTGAKNLFRFVVYIIQ